jgi:hypothetical protein
VTTPIHPSLPLARWINTGNRYTLENYGIGLTMALLFGGYFLMYLHESVWGAAGADRPFSYLLAISAWILCLAALFALAWRMVTAGLTESLSRAALAAAALAVVGTSVVPAVLGTTGLLNGIGFVLVTLLVQAAWLIGMLLVISTARIKHFDDNNTDTEAG